MTTAASMGQNGREMVVDKRAWVQAAARVGYTARGLLYTMIGVLALQLALGHRRGETDRTGAVEEIGSKPFGRVLLIALAAAFLAYAGWHLLEAALNFEHEKAPGRAFRLFRAIIYISISWATVSYALHSKAENGDQQSRDFTARVFSWPAGRLLVALVGVVLLGVAAYSGRQATGERFKKRLKRDELSPREDNLISVMARVGLFARAIVATTIAVFFFQAAWTHDPDKATGLDDALRRIANAPYGRGVLAGLSAGLIAFGVWSFAEARYRRVMNG